MSEHTPGPWASVPCQADHGATTAIQDVASDILARVPAGPRAVANAQLIAAAPDLLAHLEELTRLISNYLSGRLVAWPASALPHAHNMLAKARGEG